MKRVVIAPKMASVGLAALTLFAVSGLAIGGLMLAGADAVAKNAGGSPLGVRVGGAAFAAMGVWVLFGAVRQWPAIAAIYVDEDGWGLVDRLGRITALDAGTAVDVWLRCRRVVFTWGGAPRIQDVVDGTIEAGTVKRRLAPSGRHTYGRVLEQLGIAAAAPPRGQNVRHRTRT